MVTKCIPTYMGNRGLVVTIWLPLGTFAGFRVTKVWSVKASHEIAGRHTRYSLRAASGPSKARESSLALCRLAAQHSLSSRKKASTASNERSYVPAKLRDDPRMESKNTGGDWRHRNELEVILLGL
jgi:hypothetical protein